MTPHAWVGRCPGCGALRAAASEKLGEAHLKKSRRDWAGCGLEVVRMESSAVKTADWECSCKSVVAKWTEGEPG